MLKGIGRGAKPTMKKQPAIERGSDTERLTILVVSPLEEDHLSLQAIVGHPTYSTWILFNASDLVSAFALLQQHEIGVVVCDQELRPGTWIDMLKHLNALPVAPPLIVTSRLADWHLWAKALSLGAWDVLAKPLNLSELIRSVQSASQNRYDQTGLRATALKMVAEAS
jgi:DNA-binding NtrC family response regulator